MYSNLLLLLFYLTSFVLMADGGVKEDADSLMRGLENLNSEEYVKNGKFYNPKTGALFYPGSNVGYSEELTLFFKRHFALTTPYFNITFCLGEMNSTDRVLKCEEGILLCYESQAKAWFLREKYSNDDVPLRKRFDDPELACENSTHFGIYVSANTSHFTVKASLDANNYQFEIPPRRHKDHNIKCFVVNFGSSTSLETTITDVHGKKLIETGNPPENLDPETPYFDKETNNFWMLLIDFTPYYPKYYPFFARPFYFRGGGKPCKLSAEFSTDTVHVCKQDMEHIGSCEPQNLNSADIECKVTLSASESVEQGTDKQTSQSSTDTESKTNTDGGETNTQDEMSFGVETEICAKGGVPHIFENQVTVRLKGGYRRQWEHKHVFSTEYKKETAKTKGSSDTQIYREVTTKGKTIEMMIHRTDGGSVNFFQLVLDCAGDTIRYHKVYAVGDKDHGQNDSVQSSTVYEWRTGKAPLQNINVNIDASKDINIENTGNRKASKDYD